MLEAFTTYSGCSNLSQLNLFRLRNRVKENRDRDFMESYGKGVIAASWPGWIRSDINSTDEKRVLGKKKCKTAIRDHLEKKTLTKTVSMMGDHRPAMRRSIHRI